MADETKTTEYLLQVSVEADDLKEAIEKFTSGKIISGGPMPKAGSGMARMLPAQQQGQQRPAIQQQGRAMSQTG